jgi:WD40 repeat protein
MYDGSVAVFDVQRSGEDSEASALESDFKHLDPVWGVQWIYQGDDRGESIVSVSSDGRVLQWSIKKGLEHTELTKLKRSSIKVDQKSETILTRQARGLCIDFTPNDPNTYLVGTEDGEG